MSKHVKHTPKHRNAPVRAISTDAPKRALRTTLLLSSVAVAATGVAVSAGVMNQSAGMTGVAQDIGDTLVPLAGAPANANQAEHASRTTTVSRSTSRTDRRDAADPTKEAALSSAEGPAMTRTEDLSTGDPRVVAQALLTEFGYAQDQFSCLDSLWTRESNWRVNADNPSSSAYGIPQALPGSKMSTAGADWATNPVTQIRWGLGYIQDRYGSPCSAWGHSESYGWY
ncbi:MAG: secreted protein [Nocardioides sp.]|nr:secreted protein [Nocardioides sp.]